MNNFRDTRSGNEIAKTVNSKVMNDFNDDH